MKMFKVLLSVHVTRAGVSIIPGWHVLSDSVSKHEWPHFQFPLFFVHAEGSVAGENGRNVLMRGWEGHDVLIKLTLVEGEEDVYKQAVDAFNTYFVPKRNRE